MRTMLPSASASLPRRRPQKTDSAMERVEQVVEVDAPLSVVYNQWTQFEEFPEFMEGVTDVRQLDCRRLYWRAEILGKEFNWDAEIYEQIPDNRIAWRSTSGNRNAGAVYFAPVGEKTQVRLVIEYIPADVSEDHEEARRVVSARVEKNLSSFRDFIERRGRETGGWRGEIREGLRPEVRPGR
jgi:uncharacterized membrane protein